MIESGYYPPGAEFDPNAPWNQKENEERTFNVCISQTLSKSTSVETNDYVPEVDEDEMGKFECLDTSDTDWNKAYLDNHLTPLQLIEKFKEFLTKHLPDPIVNVKSYKDWKYLISECENWVEDEMEVMED